MVCSIEKAWADCSEVVPEASLMEGKVVIKELCEALRYQKVIMGIS